MGSWIALNLFKNFKKQIKGFIGIASAPEFLHELMWKNFSKKVKKEIFLKKLYYLNHGNFIYPLTKQLFLDGKKHIFSTKYRYTYLPRCTKTTTTNIYIYKQQVELLYLSSKKKTNKHIYHVEIRSYFIKTMH